MPHISYEELSRKLSLIDENKNLLPYPYEANISSYTGLEDVGDGSILTTSTTSSKKIPLKVFSLPKGTYTTSIEVADIINGTAFTNTDFTLNIAGATVDDSGQFELRSESTIAVSLNVPSDVRAGLVIKPMIRKSGTAADWVPNMDKIGTYVDRRFNGTNAKIRVIQEQIDSFVNVAEVGQ